MGAYCSCSCNNDFYNDSGISASVENCYNIGSVGDGTYTGGVVGYNEGGGNVTGCYFLTGTAEKGIGVNEGNDSADATPVDDLDALCEKFENDPGWSIHPVLGRPVLNENKEGGLGTDKSPYEISTATQLENFAVAVNTGSEQSAHAKLMNNIDLNPGMTYDDDGQLFNPDDLTTWGPIGTSKENAYTGTFDGNGNTIENLYINNTTNDYYQGLFGYVGTRGTVQNLSVSGSVSVSDGEDVGGVVGYNSSGTVTNCTFSGSVSGSGNHVGGIVGQNFGGTVTGCAFSGNFFHRKHTCVMPGQPADFIFLRPSSVSVHYHGNVPGQTLFIRHVSLHKQCGCPVSSHTDR